jgi:Cft2 family RNA processing exonuclease
MQMKFVGATERVTGSCTWMKYKKTKIEFLIDCGSTVSRKLNFFDKNGCCI